MGAINPSTHSKVGYKGALKASKSIVALWVGVGYGGVAWVVVVWVFTVHLSLSARVRVMPLHHIASLAKVPRPA